MVQTENIADCRQLFVDRALVDRMDGVSLKLHEPVSGGTAIRIDRPWEGPLNGVGSVFEHNGRFHLYYRAMTLEPGDESGVLCVATSSNGVDWIKPALGLVAHKGRLDTNMVAEENGKGFMATPWLDMRPGVPDDERIKAIASHPVSGKTHTAFEDPIGPKRLVFWCSSDGFQFRKLAPQPELVSDLPNCFDGGNTLSWSETEQQYVLYYRFFDGQYRPNLAGYRSIARTTSKDLLHWTDSVPMTYGDTPREHLYMNNTEPYMRAPHIYVGVAARFMQGRRAITTVQADAIGLKTAKDLGRDPACHDWSNDCSDGVLLTSRAGSTRYDRTFMETFIRPGLGVENWTSRSNYPGTGILPYGTDQIILFVSRRYLQDAWYIERLLLRADGFASVNAPWTGGEMVTKPFVFAGRELEINYRTGAPGFVRVEIQDADGPARTGHTLSECPEIIGDEITRIVTWERSADVSHLANRPVRLRFVLKDADLFSFKFRSESYE